MSSVHNVFPDSLEREVRTSCIANLFFIKFINL